MACLHLCMAFEVVTEAHDFEELPVPSKELQEGEICQALGCAQFSNKSHTANGCSGLVDTSH